MPFGAVVSGGAGSPLDIFDADGEPAVSTGDLDSADAGSEGVLPEKSFELF